MDYIQLPSSEEITRRLNKVSGELYFVERYYPLIAAHAGEQLDVRGMAILLFESAETFLRNAPFKASLMLLLPITDHLPHFAKALIDDKDFRVAVLVEIGRLADESRPI